MILGSDRDQEATYWYEGRCPYSGEILRLPRTVQVEELAKELMQEIATANPSELQEGKMYGVLLVESTMGEKILLKAFSGLLNGTSHLDGWVPPIAGREKVAIAESVTLTKLESIKQELIQLSLIPERQEYTLRSQIYAERLQALRDQHQVAKQARQILRSQSSADLVQLDRESQLEKMARRNFKRDRDQVLQPLQQVIADADARMALLKKERRELSRTLQTQMHSAYVLTNFAGETRSLRELITDGAMPTGMGDCCAPKLLHYAATHNLTPLAMAEFWWGRPSPDGYKIQGEFYGACVERCQPLMGFLLSGRQSFSTLPKFADFALQNLQIIYEDDCLIAIAKPAGLLSVPGRYLDTQDSVLIRLQQSLGVDIPLYPVHRLDRQTSGILLFARDLESLRNLQQQFQQREVQKIYEALISGTIKHLQGTIDLPLWGNPENRPYQQVDFERGKPSLTQFQVIGTKEKYPRIEFKPLTGRTHQLRVHAADGRGLGMTILGDRLYGCEAATDRLHLHARDLTFRHPRSQNRIDLQISVPF